VNVLCDGPFRDPFDKERDFTVSFGLPFPCTTLTLPVYAAKLDWMLLSKGLAPRRVLVSKGAPSDHEYLYAEVELAHLSS